MNVSRSGFLIGINLAQLPVAMQSLLLVVLGQHNTGSYAVAGLAAAAASVGFGLTAPLWGWLLGRHGHRRVLLGVGLAALLASVGVAASRTPGQFVVAAALLGLATPPAMSSARAVLAETVPVPELGRVYAVNAVVQELTYVTGPLWVSLWIALAGPAAALLGSAAVGGVALVAAAVLAPGRPVRVPRPSGRVLARPGVRTLVIVNLSYMACMGAMWVLIPAFAAEAGHPGRAGLLVTVWSLGSAAGGLAFSLGRQRMRPRTGYLLLLGVLAATSIPLALADSLWQLGPLLVGFGLGLAPWLALGDRLLARLAPPPHTGQAYGWVVTAGQAGMAAGAAAAGALADRHASGAPFLLVTAALLVALAVAVGRRDTLEPAAAVQPESNVTSLL